MPSTIENCKSFRIKRTTVLEGETFLRNKHKTEFFEIKCTYCGRKENTIKYSLKVCVFALLAAQSFIIYVSISVFFLTSKTKNFDV